MDTVHSSNRKPEDEEDYLQNEMPEGNSANEFEIKRLNNRNPQKDNKCIREFLNKLGLVLTNITVEPCMMLYAVSFILCTLTTQNLILEKACRNNLNYSDEICTKMMLQNFTEPNKYERESQKLLASALAWKSILIAIIPSVTSLFIGSWSDKTGRRKVFLVIVIVGQIVFCVNDLLHVLYFKEFTIKSLVFSESVIDGFTGGWCICLLILFCYISAITTEESRTFRLGVLNFCQTISMPLGSVIAGVVLNKLGYYGGYGVTIILHITNFAYTVFFIKDAKRTKEQKQHDNRGVIYFLKTFFDLSIISNTIKVVFKNGNLKNRIHMCILVATSGVLFGPMYGELSILYMYCRYKFNWDELKFSVFTTYNCILHTIGTMLAITLFSKIWKWHDSVLGITATFSKIAGSVLYCFAYNDMTVYLVPCLEILSGTTLLAVRSIVSKSVARDELGRANSIFSIVDGLTPLIYVPLYTKVYSTTIKVLPGAVFLMGSGMTLPAIAVFGWIFYVHKKENKAVPQAEVEVPLNVIDS